ncbi:hypothetical protein AHAS_Ahas06G0254700 [Arachis hypogaea]
MSRATVEEAAHGFRGGHCGDEVNLNISALPTDLILKIFLCSDGKTIGRGGTMVLHLDNPLKGADCGRLFMFVFGTRVAAPLDWTWFSLVGTDTGKLCARYSIDGRSSSLITWDPFGSWSMVGCDDYKILSLTNRNLTTPGYDVQMYLSSAEIGAAACVDYSTFSTLIGHDDYVDFVTYERSALRFGVHVMTINFRPGGAMAWGRHLFIGVTNLTETPCLKIGRELLGISHCVRDFEGVESSLDAVVSEAKFRSIGLADRVVTLIGSPRFISFPLQTLESAVTHLSQVGTASRVCDCSADSSCGRFYGSCSSAWPTHFHFRVTWLRLLCGNAYFRNFEDIRFVGAAFLNYGLLPAQGE